MTDPIIRTKLRLPFTRPGLVPRPRLLEKIIQGLRGPLTLVTAPAGFGKTTLVASCIANCAIPTAWLSLDKHDNQAGRFLNYLVTAIQTADPAAGSDAAQRILANPQASPEGILTSLVNDLDLSGREIVLVLDDYHFISSPVVHSAVNFLLDHCPISLHLVIASRSDPPLPLARLRARGQAVELRAADLSFTVPETAQFLNDVMGLHLDAGSVAMLEERTEGWIAGLQMAALSMRDRKDTAGFIEGFSGTNRYILDYLLEEVLSSQPQEIQHFLISTAFLERLAAPLCDAVLAEDQESQETGADRLDQSAAMLAHLDRANLFLVPLDDERRWYRYHHLFADLLQAKLYQAGYTAVAQLQSRAARWCAQNGHINEAVGYAFAARDYQQAAALIAGNWQQKTNTGEIETVWSWLSALPEDIVRSSASLSIIYAWLLWLTGQTGAIEGRLLDAERALGGQDTAQEPGGDSDFAVDLAIMHSFITRYQGKFDESIAFANRALSLMPGDAPGQDSAQLYSIIHLALGTTSEGMGDLEKAANAYNESIRWSRLNNSAAGVTITIRLTGVLRLLGRLRDADAACRNALAYIEAQGMNRLPAAGILHVAMSEVLVEQNDLDAAESHLAQAIELGKWSGRLDAVKNAAFSLSRLRLAHQDPDGALAAVLEAEASLGDPPSPLAKSELLSLRARVLIHLEDLDQAADCASEAGRLAGQDRGQTGAMAALAGLRVMIAQSTPAGAAAQLARAIAEAEACSRTGVAIELRILYSLVLAQQGDTLAAEASLERALALAEKEGYVHTFIEEGEPLQVLLARWLAHAGDSPLREYAGFLLAQFDTGLQPLIAAPPEYPGAAELVEPLSQRELEVLHLIAIGKTNQEIARQLVVAPGTIKAHAASIYRKLDVANRTEAVARARQLGLLP